MLNLGIFLRFFFVNLAQKMNLRNLCGYQVQPENDENGPHKTELDGEMWSVAYASLGVTGPGLGQRVDLTL